MAQCKLTPHEYVQNAFAPQVAVLCSEDADNLCLKNNLRFVELIQPFCRLNSESESLHVCGCSVRNCCTGQMIKGNSMGPAHTPHASVGTILSPAPEPTLTGTYFLIKD